MIGSCNTGQLSCCDTSKKVDESTGEESGLLHTGDILSQVALQCTQVPILAIAIEDECKNVSEFIYMLLLWFLKFSLDSSLL